MKFSDKKTGSNDQKIVVLSLKGEIGYSNPSVNELVEFFSLDDGEDKDIVLIVNSHGGSLACAQTVTSYIDRWKSRKVGTIYGVVEDVSLSAAYYVLLACDSIYSEAASIVGGVGAIVKMDDYSGFYDKLGISVNTYKSGDYKDLMNVKRPLDVHEEEMIQSIVQESHQQFVQRLLECRPELEKSPEVQQGMWYTGKGAKSIGLIDETTGYPGLIEALEHKHNSQGKRLCVELIESTVQPSEQTNLLARVLGKLGLNASLSDMWVK